MTEEVEHHLCGSNSVFGGAENTSPAPFGGTLPKGEGFSGIISDKFKKKRLTKPNF